MTVAELIEGLMGMGSDKRVLMVIHELDDTQAFEVVEVVAGYRREGDVHFPEVDELDSFVSAGVDEEVVVIR